jgi:hypothetical protein
MSGQLKRPAVLTLERELPVMLEWGGWWGFCVGVHVIERIKVSCFLFLSAFSKLRKATIRFVMSDRTE